MRSIANPNPKSFDFQALYAHLTSGSGDRRHLWATIFLLGGLVALYVPMLVEFGAKLWWGEDDSHAGILLLCILGGYWVERKKFRWVASRAEFILGHLSIMAGLSFYWLGQVTNLVQLLGISFPAIATGLQLVIGGFALVRRLWLLNLLLIFTLPWLGPFTDSMLVPLRLQVTSLAVSLLYHLGLPVSATGVMINVGFVQLNVAGACVGLRSMLSIIALGLLFLHFYPPRSIALACLFVCALPVIALGANFLRVCALVSAAAFGGAGGVAAMHDIAAYAEIIISIGAFLMLAHLLAERPSAS
ncbi:MAG: exosortase/archaeosortase family protein [Sphingobium sp.]